MTDDLLIRPALRRRIVSVEPVTLGTTELLELQAAFRVCDGVRIRNARLEERLKVQEDRIDRLRGIVTLHRRETEQLQTIAQGAMTERDAAVIARDNTLAELRATEEQVVALRHELERMRAGVPV